MHSSSSTALSLVSTVFAIARSTRGIVGRRISQRLNSDAKNILELLQEEVCQKKRAETITIFKSEGRETPLARCKIRLCFRALSNISPCDIAICNEITPADNS